MDRVWIFGNRFRKSSERENDNVRACGWWFDFFFFWQFSSAPLFLGNPHEGAHGIPSPPAINRSGRHAFRGSGGVLWAGTNAISGRGSNDKRSIVRCAPVRAPVVWFARFFKRDTENETCPENIAKTRKSYRFGGVRCGEHKNGISSPVLGPLRVESTDLRGHP